MESESNSPLCPNCKQEDMEYLEEDMEGNPIHICHYCGYSEPA